MVVPSLAALAEAAVRSAVHLVLRADRLPQPWAEVLRRAALARLTLETSPFARWKLWLALDRGLRAVLKSGTSEDRIISLLKVRSKSDRAEAKRDSLGGLEAVLFRLVEEETNRQKAASRAVGRRAKSGGGGTRREVSKSSKRRTTREHAKCDAAWSSGKGRIGKAISTRRGRAERAAGAKSCPAGERRMWKVVRALPP